MAKEKQTLLKFDEVRDTGRTKVWVVLNNHGVWLGQVSWWTHWRRYVFATAADVPVILDVDCLTEIITFIQARMQEHAAAVAERRTLQAAEDAALDHTAAAPTEASPFW